MNLMLVRFSSNVPFNFNLYYLMVLSGVVVVMFLRVLLTGVIKKRLLQL